MEMIMMKIIIKNRARPTKIPCCNNINVTETIFYHSKNCKGNIFFIQYHKNLIIGCEKCKQFYFKDKFIWTCPSCGKEFREKQSESKEINHIPKSDNIDLSKNNYLNEKLNNYNYKKENNELNEMVIVKKDIDNEKNINNANNNINNKKEPQINVIVPRKNRREISAELRNHQNIEDVIDKKESAPYRDERKNKISNRNNENIINNIEKEYSALQQNYETETESLTKEKESITEKLNDLTIKKKQLGDQLDSQHCNDQTIILKLRNEFKLKKNKNS